MKEKKSGEASASARVARYRYIESRDGESPGRHVVACRPRITANSPREKGHTLREEEEQVTSGQCVLRGPCGVKILAIVSLCARRPEVMLS